MSFARGSEVMDSVIKVILEHVEDFDVRVLIYEEVANTIWEMDGDTLDECLDKDDAYNKALENIGYLDEEEEDYTLEDMGLYDEDD